MELDSVWMESACSSQATDKELQPQHEGVPHKLTPHPPPRSIMELILEEAALLQNHSAAFAHLSTVRDSRPGLLPIAAGLRTTLVLNDSSMLSPGPPPVSGKREALQPAGAGRGHDAPVCGQTPESPG